MKLTLLDVEEYVKKNDLKKVSSIRIYERSGKMDASGLFSEEIFGRLGSNERREKFGYINLKTKFIHPEVWDILVGTNVYISKLLSGKMNFVLNDGILIENEEGQSGVLYFTQIAEKIDWDQFKKLKPDNVKFIKANLNKILINKYLVLPAGIRDIQVTRTSGKTITQFSDLSKLYSNLIQHSRSLPDDINSLPFDLASTIVREIQRTLMDVNDWIKKRMKGKGGLIRGGLLKKTVDYSGRWVVASDPTLKLGWIGLPWQSVLKLYEPFALNHILYKNTKVLDLIKDNLKYEENPDINDLKRLFGSLNETPEIISEELRDELFKVAEEIIKDKVVAYKRDPVENRDSWLSANVRVDKTGFTMKLNPFDLPRTGGDHDGDTYAVYALFSKEAQQEAKEKMSPIHSKNMWTSVTQASQCPYIMDLDAATAIYAATRK